MGKYTDKDYLACEPFPVNESDIKCRQITIRTARKQHTCWTLTGDMDHPIEPGERHYHEKAIVDGVWGEYRLCLQCMDQLVDGKQGGGE